MATMTTEQYERWNKALKAGDTELVREIESEGYGGKSNKILDADIISEPTFLPTSDDILAMRDEGMKDKEIGEKYNVSRQKISAIMKQGE